MASQRPKRRIIPKKLDDDGMHWREEQDILKAMYASIRGYQPTTSASEEEEPEKLKPKRKKSLLSNLCTNSKLDNTKSSKTSCNHTPVSTSSKNSTITATTSTRASVTSRTSSPSATSRTSSPSVNSRTSSPSVISRTSSPSVKSRTSSPSVTSRTSSPTVKPRTSSPSVKPRTSSPSVKPRTSSPSTTSIRTTSSLSVKLKTKKLNAAVATYAKRQARLAESRYPRRTAKTKPSIQMKAVRVGRPRRKPVMVERPPVNGSKEKASEHKVRAQRKFAQSLPTTPSTTPVKLFTCGQPELVRACPKTEDFLTFLCLKGSPALPHDLSFFESSESKRAEDVEETQSQVDDGQFSIPGIEAIHDNQASLNSQHLTKDTSAVPNNSSSPPCLDPVPPPISAIPRKRAPPRLLPMIPFIEKGHPNGLRKPRKERKLKGLHNKNHVLKKNGIKGPKHRNPFNNNNNHHKILNKNNCTYLEGRLLNGTLNHTKPNCTLDDFLAAIKQTKNGRISKRRHNLLKCRTKGIDNNNSVAYNVNDKLLQATNLTLPNNGLTHLKDRLKSRTKVDSKITVNSVSEKISKNHVKSVNHVISTDQSKIKRKRGRPKRNLDIQLLQTKNASKIYEAENKTTDTKLPQGSEIPAGNVSLAKKRRRTSSSRFQYDLTNCTKTFVTSHNRSPINRSPTTRSPTNRSPKRTRNSLPIHAKVVATDAPVLYPNQGSWSDPIAYLTAMSDDLEKCGICKVVPPKGSRPECKLKDDMRFNTEVQYINRLYHRWNLESRQLACIKRHLKEQGNSMGQPPQVGGCEVDLVRLSQILSEQDGMKSENVSKWNKIADTLRIPKTVQGRVNKLYKIYCECLVSYHTLTSEEKLKLDHALEKERTKSHKLGIFNSVDEENCIKGRCVSLQQFCKSAHNTLQMNFKREPTATEVEKEYWRSVTEASQHISVMKASIPTTLSGRHSWHLTNVCTNQLNLLHCLGNKHSMNIPVMKINMLYSTETWHCNQHALATIDYLHTGAPKIWYCIPASHHEQAKEVVKQEYPQHSANTLHPLNNANFKCMVPISSFLRAGIPVYRLVQEAGQFVVSWPGMAIATVSCGYNVTEVVNFATASWLAQGQASFQIFQDLKESCQFSFEHLLTLLASQPGLHGNSYLMDQVLALLNDVRDREIILRKKLAERGMKTSIRFVDPASPARIRDKRSKPISGETGEEHICWICKCSCFLSMVVQEKEGRVYCLSHGLEATQKPKVCRTLKLMYRYSEDELQTMVTDLKASMKQAECGKTPSPKRRKKRKNSLTQEKQDER